MRPGRPGRRCPVASPRRPTTLLAAALVLAAGAAGPAPVATGEADRGGWGFTEATDAAGVAFMHAHAGGDVQTPRKLSGGVAAGDYDGDGWIDLYAATGSSGGNYLFRNRRDGTFEEVAVAAGVSTPGMKTNGPLFADLTGDGHLDLLLGGIESDSSPRLFRNLGDGTFEEITAFSGLLSWRDTFSSAAGDIDRDGDLDLFSAHWWVHGGGTGHLWINQGDGSFFEAGPAYGLLDAFLDQDLTFSPNFVDLDNDGWLDLTIAGDFSTSRVFHNRGDGTFEETTQLDVITDENGMGATVIDYDNDGDIDWFVTSIWDPDGIAQGNWGITGNRLYRNLGDGSFEDVTEEAGVRRGYWGWGACSADFDNDGWPDLFHVNGISFPLVPEFQQDPARLFMNNGDGTFSERSAELGIEELDQGRGVVCFDYDRDGDIDLFVANNTGPSRLYRNDGGNAQGHWLQVRLTGLPPTPTAVGARVEVTAGGITQLRELRSGSNYLSQDPLTVHFGLGTAAVIDELKITWPDGAVTVRTDVEADRHLEIVQGMVSPVEVPALSPAALAALAGLLALAALVGLRRRPAAR